MNRVDMNRRDLNWLASTFTDGPHGPVEERHPYPCDRCSTEAKYASGTGELLCTAHHVENQLAMRTTKETQ